MNKITPFISAIIMLMISGTLSADRHGRGHAREHRRTYENHHNGYHNGYYDGYGDRFRDYGRSYSYRGATPNFSLNLPFINFSMGRPGFNYSPYAYNDCYSMNNGSCYRNSNYCGWNNYSNRCESRYYY